MSHHRCRALGVKELLFLAQRRQSPAGALARESGAERQGSLHAATGGDVVVLVGALQPGIGAIAGRGERCNAQGDARVSGAHEKRAPVLRLLHGEVGEHLAQARESSRFASHCSGLM